MGRRTSGMPYVTPILSDGTEQKQDATADTSGGEGTGRGWFYLEVGTYFYPLGCGDGSLGSVHLQHDAAVAISAAAVETSDLHEQDARNYSDNAGEWFRQNPSDAYVPTDGASTTATLAVVAVVAGNKGGAQWNIADLASRRGRLAVVVTTAGKVRVAFTAKD